MDEKMIGIAKEMVKRVEFLTGHDEKERYAAALVRAMEWGRERDVMNEEYYRKNRLKEKYPVYLPEL